MQEYDDVEGDDEGDQTHSDSTDRGYNAELFLGDLAGDTSDVTRKLITGTAAVCLCICVVVLVIFCISGHAPLKAKFPWYSGTYCLVVFFR